MDPYSLFLFSLKSRESRLKYAQRINRFFDFIEIPPGETAVRCKAFFQKGHEDSIYSKIMINIYKLLKKGKKQMGICLE
jgi:hypothetical protein